MSNMTLVLVLCNKLQATKLAYVLKATTIEMVLPS